MIEILMLLCPLAIPQKLCTIETAVMHFRSDPVYQICPLPFEYSRPLDNGRYLRAFCVRAGEDRPLRGSGGAR